MQTLSVPHRKVHPSTAKRLFREFAEGITVWLKAHALPHGGLYEWKLATGAGILELRPNAGLHLASLFCRFDEPQRAKAAGLDCNPHTGKWNHHWEAEQLREHGVKAYVDWTIAEIEAIGGAA